MKVYLKKSASNEGYSLEAGIADGKRNFDHHGQNSNEPSPCNDARIPVIGLNEFVEISHIDADTFVGLLRMAGKPLPKIDLALLEQIDLNGSSICRDKFDPTLLYAVGVGALARKLNFPRLTETCQDVSEFVEKMISLPDNEIIELGREAQSSAEVAYINRKVAVDDKVGFWAVGAQDPFDPSRPYEDGTEIVVVYRDHFKTISVYCDPESQYAFAGKTIAGIEFGGHPKACGSPRGVAYTQEDAQSVFDAIVNLSR